MLDFVVGGQQKKPTRIGCGWAFDGWTTRSWLSGQAASRATPVKQISSGKPTKLQVAAVILRAAEKLLHGGHHPPYRLKRNNHLGK